MEDKWKSKIVYAAATLLGALCFFAVYGVRVLNPLYDDWLLGRGDLTQHYLGWCFYRQGAWTFPLGLTDRLAYPDYSSVIFTDSIPLLAIVFKLLSPVLPETFQYFGWWGLGCFMLQGFFAAKLLDRLRVGSLQVLAGSVLFILSPVVIEKMFRHTALGGHWIILAAIYLFVCHKELYTDVKKTALYWGLIGAYVGSVHMYFLPMCGVFLGGFVLCSLLQKGALRTKIRYLLPGVTFLLGLFVCTYLFGGFSTRAEAGSSDLGEFSFNLNGFFNAKGYSRFFPALATYHDGQYEGFAYLGLGVFVLLAVALVFLARFVLQGIFSAKRGNGARQGGLDRDFILYGVMYVLMSVGLILFAASPEVTFGDKLLFVLTDSSTLTHYWGMFRSSGRIVWPVCYLMILGAIVCNDRLFQKKRIATAVLVVCVCLQIFDISGKLQSQRRTFAQEITYESPLESDVWERLLEHGGFAHIVWVSHNIDNNGIMHIAKYAYDNGLTMNNFYFARGINVNENTKQSLENPKQDCIFIFRSDETQGIDEYGLRLYEADGYIIGTVDEID